MKQHQFFSFVLALVFLAGCGGNPSLKGTVTFSDDGSPVPVGVINFETDSSFSRGTLKSDGTYLVGTLSENDGIPPGTYRVSIVGAVRDTGRVEYNEPVMEPLIDEKYSSGTTSGLTLTVPAPQGVYDIQVERYVPK